MMINGRAEGLLIRVSGCQSTQIVPTRVRPGFGGHTRRRAISFSSFYSDQETQRANREPVRLSAKRIS
jgi:hypothetical protein